MQNDKAFLGWLRHTALLAALAVPLLPLAAAAQQQALTASAVNLRAGPGFDYPVVLVLARGQWLDVVGCTEGYSWCDVELPDGLRGWIAASLLNYLYEGAESAEVVQNAEGAMPLATYGALIGVPLVTFSIGSYWGNYYRDQPWYGAPRWWQGRPPPPPSIGPGWRPPPPVRPNWSPRPPPPGWNRRPDVGRPGFAGRPPPEWPGRPGRPVRPVQPGQRDDARPVRPIPPDRPNFARPEPARPLLFDRGGGRLGAGPDARPPALNGRQLDRPDSAGARPQLRPSEQMRPPLQARPQGAPPPPPSRGGDGGSGGGGGSGAARSGISGELRSRP